MDSLMDDCSPYSRVSPFRDLRIKGYLLLPEAYRSLSRLSSALSAKASALRPSSLDLCNISSLLRKSQRGFARELHGSSAAFPDATLRCPAGLLFAEKKLPPVHPSVENIRRMS